MKKMNFWGIVSSTMVLLISCNSEKPATFIEPPPPEITITDDVTTLENYGRNGVDLEINNLYGTRADVAAVYSIRVTKEQRSKEIDLLMSVDVLTSGGYEVALFLDDEFESPVFLGKLVYDGMDKLKDVEIAPDTRARLEGECYVDCVKREYKDRKAALEDRPLDDVACAWAEGLCETLMLIGAAYDCCDEEPAAGDDDTKTSDNQK